MLERLGLESLDALIEEVVPASIREDAPLALAAGVSEAEALAELRAIADRNVVVRSLLGQGYHDCHVPAVIQRNVFENPGWYTAYTPLARPKIVLPPLTRNATPLNTVNVPRVATNGRMRK